MFTEQITALLSDCVFSSVKWVQSTKPMELMIMMMMMMIVMMVMMVMLYNAYPPLLQSSFPIWTSDSESLSLFIQTLL